MASLAQPCAVTSLETQLVHVSPTTAGWSSVSVTTFESTLGLRYAKSFIDARKIQKSLSTDTHRHGESDI
jgi:hypothetical protein